MNENECRDSYNAILEVLREVGLVSLVESVEETIREGKMTFSKQNGSKIESYGAGEKLQLLLDAVERTFRGRVDMMGYIIGSLIVHKFEEVTGDELLPDGLPEMTEEDLITMTEGKLIEKYQESMNRQLLEDKIGEMRENIFQEIRSVDLDSTEDEGNEANWSISITEFNYERYRGQIDSLLEMIDSLKQEING